MDIVSLEGPKLSQQFPTFLIYQAGIVPLGLKNEPDILDKEYFQPSYGDAGINVLYWVSSKIQATGDGRQPRARETWALPTVHIRMPVCFKASKYPRNNRGHPPQRAKFGDMIMQDCTIPEKE